ncbi:MAG: DUF4175 family protein, partial [Rhizobiaceae bacterium]
MTFERLWPRLLPLVGVAALYAILSWSGLVRILPDGARLALAAVLALLAFASLLPLRGLRLPGRAAIDRRIETENQLTHAPLTTLLDRPAGEAG